MVTWPTSQDNKVQQLPQYQQWNRNLQLPNRILNGMAMDHSLCFKIFQFSPSSSTLRGRWDLVQNMSPLWKLLVTQTQNYKSDTNSKSSGSVLYALIFVGPVDCIVALPIPHFDEKHCGVWEYSG
ncbi:hypothetical protein EYC84_004717 [Monilinia fructicola]|uniref:Uncharacterized protein n=1 Tax=Monilinia fructicola TaxID=38448 RepID=A0A5M9K547_MONFR|nr:hypothetical protein EYC84_004717 [Monilinia fructicola]